MAHLQVACTYVEGLFMLGRSHKVADKMGRSGSDIMMSVGLENV